MLMYFGTLLILIALYLQGGNLWVAHLRRHRGSHISGVPIVPWILACAGVMFIHPPRQELVLVTVTAASVVLFLIEGYYGVPKKKDT